MGVGAGPTLEPTPGRMHLGTMGIRKETNWAVGDGKFKHITTGCHCRLPLHFWAGVEKGGGLVPHPESTSSLSTLRSVVVGLLLPISQSAALGQVGSAVSLPGRILSPWKSHRVRTNQTSRPQALLQILLPLLGLQKRLPLPLMPAPSKMPFPEVCGGEAVDEKESQMWAGYLGIEVLGGSRARHPVDF